MLFVSKLNAATDDESLYLIFSRFGTLKLLGITRLGIASAIVSLSLKTKRPVNEHITRWITLKLIIEGYILILARVLQNRGPYIDPTKDQCGECYVQIEFSFML